MPSVESATLGSEDLDLVTRHRYGDEQAFEELYGRYEPLVYNLALRMTGDRDHAADLAQEAFLRIHGNLASYRGRSSLKTWVFQVALNCFRSRLRRRGWRRRAVEPEEPLERLADARRDPESRLLAKDAGERVQAALALLPVPFREAVVLRDLQGLSYREIARICKVRIGTVRSRLARGRERLRQLLEGAE
ncbi:MAG: sigma-70 family RNA polymerase sigma factor [Thermoanaerobaculia bacterium]|nr:sigma-70 family RNA polymerase sigma factor [Thermoanaerobaculia bacterium]